MLNKAIELIKDKEDLECFIEQLEDDDINYIEFNTGGAYFIPQDKNEAEIRGVLLKWAKNKLSNVKKELEIELRRAYEKL